MHKVSRRGRRVVKISDWRWGVTWQFAKVARVRWQWWRRGWDLSCLTRGCATGVTYHPKETTDLVQDWTYKTGRQVRYLVSHRGRHGSWVPPNPSAPVEAGQLLLNGVEFPITICSNKKVLQGRWLKRRTNISLPESDLCFVFLEFLEPKAIRLFRPRNFATSGDTTRGHQIQNWTPRRNNTTNRNISSPRAL